MKIRNGFVANSSSSSFIVAFPKKPETKEELRDYMFPRKMERVSPWSGEKGLTVDEVVDHVFQQIKNEKSASYDEVVAAMRGFTNIVLESTWDYFQSTIQRSNYDTNEEYLKDWHAAMDKLREQERKIEAIEAEAFWKENKGKFIFITEYRDETYVGSVLEHGDIFRNFNHIQIGNH